MSASGRMPNTQRFPFADSTATYVIPVADVQPMELEARPSLQPGQPPVLKAYVVAVVEIVHTHYHVAVRQQKFGDFPAYKANTTRHEDVQR